MVIADVEWEMEPMDNSSVDIDGNCCMEKSFVVCIALGEGLALVFDED